MRLPVRVRLLDAMRKRLVQVEQEQLRDMRLGPLDVESLLTDLVERNFELLQEVDRLVDVDRKLHVDGSFQSGSFVLQRRFCMPECSALAVVAGGSLSVLLARVVCHVDFR